MRPGANKTKKRPTIAHLPTPHLNRTCENGQFNVNWSVNEGKAHINLPDLTLGFRVEVLTLSGMHTIEVNRFDSAARYLPWDSDFQPNPNQKRLITKLFGFIISDWKDDINMTTTPTDTNSNRSNPHPSISMNRTQHLRYGQATTNSLHTPILSAALARPPLNYPSSVPQQHPSHSNSLVNPHSMSHSMPPVILPPSAAYPGCPMPNPMPSGSTMRYPVHPVLPGPSPFVTPSEWSANEIYSPIPIRPSIAPPTLLPRPPTHNPYNNHQLQQEPINLTSPEIPAPIDIRPQIRPISPNLPPARPNTPVPTSGAPVSEYPSTNLDLSPILEETVNTTLKHARVELDKCRQEMLEVVHGPSPSTSQEENVSTNAPGTPRATPQSAKRLKES